MERALAHIERVIGIFPIEGADQIEAAQVLGWYVVVKKGDFKVDDLCVFFEIDSFLNGTDPRYAAFEPRFVNWEGKRGMRLKTIKLRGQISQGLILKIDEFPEVKGKFEGDDVTELLKIEKWMPAEEIHANGGPQSKKASDFPSFIRKTDQTRIQSLQSVIDRYLDELFEVSIKLDGSSMTVFNVPVRSSYYEDAFDLFNKKSKKLLPRIKAFFKKLFMKSEEKEPIAGVCSRNILLKSDDESHFTNYCAENKLVEKLTALGKPYAIQGELIGPTIQSNYEKVSDFEYNVFDIFNIETQSYMIPAEATVVANTLGIKHVPVLHASITLRELVGGETDKTKIVAKILELAEGPGMNPSVKREGLVFKHLHSDFSFKAISNSYLLKKEKGRG